MPVVPAVCKERRNTMQPTRLSMRILISSFLLLAVAGPAFAYNHARRGPTSPNLFKRRASSKIGIHSSGKPAGPRVIDSERATQIQAALIKNGYMTGTPSGHWDTESQSAMQRLQGAQGWQTKLTPDSRALIMLGLGPNNGHDGAENFNAGNLAREDSSASSPARVSRLESTFASQQ